MPDCPAEDTLAALVAGKARDDRDAVLRHVADCPRCQEAVADLGEAAFSPAIPLPERTRGVMMGQLKRRSWIPWAAAAALLLAMVLAWHREERPLPSSGTAAVQPHPEPPSWQEAPVLGRACAVTLRPGSRMRQGVLEKGAAWVENPGEPIFLSAGGVKVASEGGTFLLEVSEPQGVAWLPSARAADERIRLFVLSGKVMADTVTVNAGMRWSPGAVPSSFRPEELAWRGDAGWHRVEGLPKRFKGGEHLLDPQPAPEAYAWELVFRRLKPSAAAGLGFAAGGKGWQVPLGAALEGAGWIRVHLEVRDGWVRLLAGSREMLKEPASRLGEKLGSAEPRLVLKSWGGELEVSEARWKEIP